MYKNPIFQGNIYVNVQNGHWQTGIQTDIQTDDRHTARQAGFQACRQTVLFGYIKLIHRMYLLRIAHFNWVRTSRLRLHTFRRRREAVSESLRASQLPRSTVVFR